MNRRSPNYPSPDASRHNNAAARSPGTSSGKKRKDRDEQEGQTGQQKAQKVNNSSKAINSGRSTTTSNSEASEQHPPSAGQADGTPAWAKQMMEQFAAMKEQMDYVTSTVKKLRSAFNDKD